MSAVLAGCGSNNDSSATPATVTATATATVTETATPTAPAAPTTPAATPTGQATSTPNTPAPGGSVTRQQAKRIALNHIGSGRVTDIGPEDDFGAKWEVEITRPNGSEVDVYVSADGRVVHTT